MGLNLANIMRKIKGSEEEKEPPVSIPEASSPEAISKPPAALPASPQEEEFLFTRLRDSKEEQARLQADDLPSFETSLFEKSEEVQKEVAKRHYLQTIQWAGQILAKARRGEMIEGSEIRRVISGMVSEQLAGKSGLLDFACSQFRWREETGFISAKMVNDAILAIEIGIGKKLNLAELFLLGLSAFLNYLGITQVLDVVTKKEMLQGGDLKKIREIPERTIEVLKKIPHLDQALFQVALQSRERIDGSGPLGIKGSENLDPLARIIAVVDVFEALTHDRPHRKRLMPYEAVKQILAEKEKFEQDILRLLVDRIGVYPVGSWVKLTSKQIAQVVECNPGQPFRPKVKVMYDEEGSPVDRQRLLDLSKDSSLQIIQPIADEELQKLGIK